jgi:membrane-associated phospholipid phosphatase
VSPRSIALPLAAAAAFAALSVLVAAGALTRLDQWAVDHAMTHIHRAGAKPTLGDALVPLLHTDFHSAVDVTANLVTAPASLVLSLLLVGACCVALGRRGRPRAAKAWAAAWIAGTAVEELCKSALTRPALYRHGVHVVGFDSSYPSGHAIRSLVVAAAVAAAWPPARRWVGAWALASIVLLEVDALHTPSDLAGGLLVSAVLIGAARRVAG